MLRRLLPAILAVLCCALASEAQAGVPIPCMSTKFLKLEGTPTKVEGASIVLHYNVFGCGQGKWDGYMDANGTYRAFTPAVRAALPIAPGFWTAAWQNPKKFWVEWLWIVVGSVCGLGYLLTVIGKALESGQPPAIGRSATPVRPMAATRASAGTGTGFGRR